MTLREAKRAIRSFIREHWSDQKLHDVYAFNRDGRMSFDDPCGCLLGVTLAAVLHQRSADVGCPAEPDSDCNHYERAEGMRGAELAENAYLALEDHAFNELLAQRRLSAIIRAEIRRRERLLRVHTLTAEFVANFEVTA